MDTGAFILLFVFVGIPAIAFGTQFIATRRLAQKRHAIATSAFPETWQSIIDQNVPLARKLPSRFKKRLNQNIQLFIAETNFEGMGGVEIDDEIRVTISAQACLLTVGREDKRYPRLKSVLVYPSSFTDGAKSPISKDNSKPLYRLGESWSSGTVILAWDSTKRGALNMEDGNNVTLHEFAHQLDQEDGVGDGAPIFESHAAIATFAKVFVKEYEIQLEKATKGKRSVIDHYGATNHAEFFAVSTETFFEKPKQLKRKRPEVYEILKEYYRLDPISWS